VVFAYIYLLITIVQLRTSLCIAVVADDTFSSNVNMAFSADGRILIENLCKFKNYDAKRLIREFPTKSWSVSSVNKPLKKLRDTNTTARCAGSGRHRSARIDDNIDSVNKLVLSQKGAPKTHRSTRQIATETGIHHSSLYRIVRQDFKLTCLKKRRAQELTAAKCTSRLIRAKKLLHLFPASVVDFVFFTDEKIFSVAAPTNFQNDRVCRSDDEETLNSCRATSEHTSNVQQVTDGVGRGVKAGMLESGVRGSRCQSQWYLLQ